MNQIMIGNFIEKNAKKNSSPNASAVTKRRKAGMTKKRILNIIAIALSSLAIICFGVYLAGKAEKILLGLGFLYSSLSILIGRIANRK